MRTAALISSDPALAEDIAQEAFVRCLLHISSLKDPRRFQAWFYRILTRCAWEAVKKIIAIAAALCLLTAGCYAAVQHVFVEMHSTSDIASYAALEDAEKKIGFDAKYIESFSNGFSFSCGSLGVMTEEQGPETPFLNIEYEKQGKRIALIIQTVIEESEDYFTQTLKSVPPDYRPTEEDLAKEAAGEYYLSYGSAAVEIKQFESYRWQDGELFYILSGFNLDMGEAQLKAMAEEIME